MRSRRKRSCAHDLSEGDARVCVRSSHAACGRSRSRRLLRRDLQGLPWRLSRVAREHIRRSRVRKARLRSRDRQRQSVQLRHAGSGYVEHRGGVVRGGQFSGTREAPGAVRGPLSRRTESEAHAGTRAGLFDGQEHRPTGVFGRRSSARRLGRDHGVPGRQCRADPIGAPEGHGTLAAHHREDAAGEIRADGRIPAMDDRRRARRCGLSRRDAGKRAGEKRRALHRVVHRDVQCRRHLCTHRPGVAGIAPRHAGGHRLVSGADQGA